MTPAKCPIHGVEPDFFRETCGGQDCILIEVISTTAYWEEVCSAITAHVAAKTAAIEAALQAEREACDEWRSRAWYSESQDEPTSFSAMINEHDARRVREKTT